MARIPGPTMKRYRGRLRAAMRSALNHLNILLNYDQAYRARPIASYPNQLAPLTEMQIIAQCSAQLGNWLIEKGAIPSR